jgi:hypothetical protein
MRENETRVSSEEALTAHPEWNSFEERSVIHAEASPAPQTAGARQEKKPYTKPTYRYEQVFETMALACGKISPTQFQCRFHRHNS